MPLAQLKLAAKFGGEVTAIGALPDDTATVIATRNGQVFVLKDGAVLENPLLDIGNRVFVASSGTERRGLADFAFSPSYAADRALYVSYTPKGTERRLRVSRFTLPNALEDVLLDIDFGAGGNSSSRFAGGLEFGPDHSLYIATGVGFSADAQLVDFPAAQNPASLEGKILRIDVSTSDGETPYAIPADNPFAGQAGARPEVWALGFRWPRIAFDGADGVRESLFIIDEIRNRTRSADEINLVTVETGTGRNFGWPFFSGLSDHDPFARPGAFEPPSDTVAPIHDGERSDYPDFVSTGGFASDGVLFFASLSSRYPGLLYYSSAPELESIWWRLGTSFDPCCRDGFTAVGQGAAGDAYYAARDGSVYRAVPRAAISPPVINASTSDGDTIHSGWANLLFAPNPYYLAVYFTIDGSEPTLESPRFDEANPLPLVENITVRAIAYHPSTGPSEIATREFKLTTAPVEIERIDTSPYVEAVFRMQTATPGAVIRYRLDGETPDQDSPVYDLENPPVVAGTQERRVVAVAFHDVLGVSEARDAFFHPQLAEAAILGDVRIVRPGQEVALTGSKGALIHFTLDGSEPDESSPVYSGPIRGEEAGWIRTLSVLDGFEPQREDALGVSVRIPIPALAEILAGDGAIRDNGGGTPALDVLLEQPAAMAAAPDGTVHIISRFEQFTSCQFLYSLAPDGLVTTYRFEDFRLQFNDIAVLPNGDLVLPRPDFPGIMVSSPENPEEAVTYGRLNGAQYRDGPLEQARFIEPRDVATDASGAIYLVDGDRLRRIRPDGVVETIGGAGWRRVEGAPIPLAESKFDDLQSIAAGPDRSLYIGDGARLLRADASGMVTFVAGSGEAGHADGRGSAADLPVLAHITVDSVGNCYTRVETSFTGEDNGLDRRLTDVHGAPIREVLR